MDINQAKDLLARYLQDQCTPVEKKLVERWYLELEETGDFILSDTEKAALGTRMEEWLKEKNLDSVPVVQISARKKIGLKSWAAAAAAVFLMGAAALYLWWPSGNLEKQVATGPVNPQNIQAPSSVYATITLSDGTTIAIDSLNQLKPAEQEGIKLIKLPTGELVYQGEQNPGNNTVLYNTLNNPRGSRVATLILSDGTRVWLNTASSITYPIAFGQHDRNVTITGEAYFEVSHDPSRPFTLNASGTEIKVLGTHFNVNSYEDEESIRVTLLEGAVDVKKAGRTQVLAPGQQAIISDGIALNTNADLERVMAWKNGSFHFENASIQQVMREIGRWYDLEVIIETQNNTRRFGGEISRDNNLGQVFQILEESKVNFTVQGKTIIVK